jgi:serine/threonine-protein kinase
VERDEEECRPLFPIVAATAASVAATIGLAVVLALVGPDRDRPQPQHFSIALPADAPIDPLHGSMALSPDGASLVYVALGDRGSHLFLRTSDRDEPRRLDGTEGARAPFFSPDGEWVGFFARGSLQKLRLRDGRTVVLAAAPTGAGAVWSADGTIVFGGGPGGGLARVPASGGEPVVLAAPAAGSPDVRFGWPDLLPGGAGIVYTAFSVSDSDVAVLDLRSGRRLTVAAHAAFGRYAGTSDVIVERHGRLEAVRLSPTFAVSEPRPIPSGPAVSGPVDGPAFAVSPTGLLVYLPGGVDQAGSSRSWLDAGGRLEAWRPDGLEIAFAFSKAGPFNLFMRPADGHAGPAPLVTSPWNQVPTSWAPGARHLAFTEFQPMTGADIWVLDVATRTRRPVVRTLFDETWARFSPDGRWLAYMSNESGRWQISVSDVGGKSPRVRVSTTGGVWPSWSADGRAVYFSSGGHTMRAGVQVDGPRISVAPPTMVPGAEAVVLAGATATDRLLVRQADEQPGGRRELRVVLQWFAELVRPWPAG